MGCAAEAESSPQAPAAPPALELTGRVVDAAEILSEPFEAQMTTILEGFEREDLVQMVVVTTPDLEGRDVKDYTVDLANAWGIGHHERDDGVVLLVAPNERRARISVGYGLETTITDAEAQRIMDEGLVPHFQLSNYEIGVFIGVRDLMCEVRTCSDPEENESEAILQEVLEEMKEAA